MTTSVTEVEDRPMPTDLDSSKETRTALVTGATSGIGRAIAGSLSAAGLRVVLLARDQTRGEAVAHEIATATGNDRIRVVVGDLAEMTSVRDASNAVERAHPALDILVNSAGVYTPERTVTADGFETMFATNLLGPFLLTNLLLPRLRAAGAARILVLSAPSGTKLDFDDLQGERRFRSLTAFGASKAADLLFTFELARRLKGSGVTANAVHPGLVRTSLMSGAPAPIRRAIRPFSRSPESAVKTIVPLALDPAFADRSGQFFHHAKAIDPPTSTRDPEVARRLWDVCADLTALDRFPTAR
jgi:NAD(P)-dependent dehydrogenase (short-subunit alcohol dehydrogenase family)